MDVVSNATVAEDETTHSISTDNNSRQVSHDDSSDEEDNINKTEMVIGNGQTYRQQLTNHIHLLREFYNGLE